MATDQSIMLAALAFTAVYLGGAGADDCDDITFDRVRYAYLACHSTSEGFTGADKKDMDAYVVKFDPRSSKILYTTRIGGSDWGRGVSRRLGRWRRGVGERHHAIGGLST